jgi:hypothetical protein
MILRLGNRHPAHLTDIPVAEGVLEDRRVDGIMRHRPSRRHWDS